MLALEMMFTVDEGLLAESISLGLNHARDFSESSHMNVLPRTNTTLPASEAFVLTSVLLIML
jgi:hypothetical protein